MLRQYCNDSGLDVHKKVVALLGDNDAPERLLDTILLAFRMLLTPKDNEQRLDWDSAMLMAHLELSVQCRLRLRGCARQALHQLEQIWSGNMGTLLSLLALTVAPYEAESTA